jgi:endonuclease YncB( thermonuclease family)
VAYRDREQVRGIATVTDGDTIHVGSAIMRLFGIDAPEAAQRCGRASSTPMGEARWIGAYGGHQASRTDDTLRYST